MFVQSFMMPNALEIAHFAKTQKQQQQQQQP